MKLHILNKVLGLGFIALCLAGCTDGNDWSTDASKSRMFSVSGNDISIVRYMTELDITFTPVKGAEAYTLEISRDTLYDEIEEGATETSQVLHLTPAEAKDTIRIKDLKKDTRYYVRIRTTSADLPPSKWSYYKDSRNRYYIKTKAEQLFYTTKYFAQTVIRPTDLFQDHIQLSWKKDEGSETAAVDHVVISNGSQQVASISLSDTEKENRRCVINYEDYGLALNTTYNFKIYNGDDKRGELNVTTPKPLPAGTHILDTDAGETLKSLIEAATADITIGIPATSPDKETPADDAISISSNINIPDGVSVALIGLPGGMPRQINFQKPINIGGTHAFLRFENLHLANNGSGYVINQKGACVLNELSFENVSSTGFNTAFIRLQNGTSEEMNIKRITMDKCNMWKMGGRFIYNNNHPTNYIDEIILTNSTFYEFTGHFIQVTTSRAYNVTINNVTFYNILGNQSWFIDANLLTPSIEINRCIFAKTNNANAKGIRNTETEKGDDHIVYSFGNCYMTNDFIFQKDPNTGDPWSGRPFSTGNNVPASTKIMKDPKNGDFTITDNTVEGGDPRWIQPSDD